MSPLAQAVDDYLALRRGLGYKLTEHGRVLPQFAAFLQQRGEPLITTALALQFAMQPAQGSVVWWHQRLAIVRGFARYLQAIERCPTCIRRRRSRRCCGRPGRCARRFALPAARR
jgi:integrase/recombinase XerD